MPEYGDVELTLTPAGPPTDGAKGQPTKLRQSQLPFEVPQGRSRFTARSIPRKGPAPTWPNVRGSAYRTGMTLSVDMVHPRL
ncbi:hypothetical protein SAMN00790413_06098 [Deinococcus hopiensis KR-140]|uniref:Uncharacterized protein n=2 Tax=Deinococcus TaxID=1298 RepID=A0A1W1VW87_9DEIO|nr:hypothetical protein SAMN00790413_06098 [Deinococcus hopiensis KR-140]